MSITWTPELSVGVEEIDNQHKELYRNVELFFEQIRKGNGQENLMNLFAFLETYVTTHFSLEEKYMAKFHVDGCSYEDAKEHKAEHRAFLRDFKAFKEEILENGPTSLLVNEFQKWILNWMAGHFGKTDRGLGRFLLSALPFLKRAGPSPVATRPQGPRRP
jgi:hemerythrin